MYTYETDPIIQSLIDHMALAKEGKSIPKEDDGVFGLDTGSLYPDILTHYERDSASIDHAQEMLHALSNSLYGLMGQCPKARKYTFKKLDRGEYEDDSRKQLIDELHKQLAYLKQKWPV
jgi:hypothetical protein